MKPVISFYNRLSRSQIMKPALVGTLLFFSGCSSEETQSQGDAQQPATQMEATAKSSDPTKPNLADQHAGSGDESLSEDDKDLLRRLKDDSAEVRADAVESIEPADKGLDYLREAISTDPSPEVRSAATNALQESEDPKAVDILVMALDDEDPEVVVDAIDALWFIEDPRAIPHLQRMLEHPDEDVREAAESALDDLQLVPIAK